MKPKYYQLKDKINEEILKGTYPLYTKLPTENELSQDYGVSRATVRSALELLVDDGIIEKKWGSGNIVVSKATSSKKATIALVIKDKKSEYVKELVEDIQAGIFKEKLELEIFATNGLMEKEREILNLILKDTYAGAIIEPLGVPLPSINNDLYQKLLKHKLPVVFLSCAPTGIQCPNVVQLNEYDLGYQNCRLLINKGYSILGGIFIRDSYRSIQRYSGFIDALRDADIPVREELFLWCNSSDQASQISRSSATIGKFLRVVSSTEAVIYKDDSSLSTEGFTFIAENSFVPAKSVGHIALSNLLEIKKGGCMKSTAIPYKLP